MDDDSSMSMLANEPSFATSFLTSFFHFSLFFRIRISIHRKSVRPICFILSSSKMLFISLSTSSSLCFR